MNKYLAVFGKPRFLGILPLPEGLQLANLSTVIVESQRGTETAVLVAPLTEQQEITYRKIRTASEHSEGQVRGGELAVTDLEYVGIGTSETEETQQQLRAEEEGVLRTSREMLIPHNLEMKLIDVEYLPDRKKLFFYFTSEQRVDFRAFVRDLARVFKTRIELRQVGVRDEAKIIKGLASCGRECCCSYWLNQFSPICIRMVKEQNLALNPTKISGVCGRLMCCMCYEHNNYKELWVGLPNPGSKISTPAGNIVLLGVDLRKKAVRCYMPGNGEVLVPVDQFSHFKETLLSGGEWVFQKEDETDSHQPPISSFPPLRAENAQGEKNRGKERSKERGERGKQPLKPAVKKDVSAGSSESNGAKKPEGEGAKKNSNRRRRPQPKKQENHGEKQNNSPTDSVAVAPALGENEKNTAPTARKKRKRPRRKTAGKNENAPSNGENKAVLE